MTFYHCFILQMLISSSLVACLRDCSQVLTPGWQTLDVPGSGLKRRVYCDYFGHMVFFRANRTSDGSLNVQGVDLKDYEAGLNVDGDDWHMLSLQTVHEMTSTGDYKLQIEMGNGEKTSKVEIAKFQLGSKKDGYPVSFGGPFNGTADLVAAFSCTKKPDSLRHPDGLKLFSKTPKECSLFGDDSCSTLRLGKVLDVSESGSQFICTGNAQTIFDWVIWKLKARHLPPGGIKRRYVKHVGKLFNGLGRSDKLELKEKEIQRYLFDGNLTSCVSAKSKGGLVKDGKLIVCSFELSQNEKKLSLQAADNYPFLGKMGIIVYGTNLNKATIEAASYGTHDINENGLFDLRKELYSNQGQVFLNQVQSCEFSHNCKELRVTVKFNNAAVQVCEVKANPCRFIQTNCEKGVCVADWRKPRGYRCSCANDAIGDNCQFRRSIHGEIFGSL